jgi:hypothetical protein
VSRRRAHRPQRHGRQHEAVPGGGQFRFAQAHSDAHGIAGARERRDRRDLDPRRDRAGLLHDRALPESRERRIVAIAVPPRVERARDDHGPHAAPHREHDRRACRIGCERHRQRRQPARNREFRGHQARGMSRQRHRVVERPGLERDVPQQTARRALRHLIRHDKGDAAPLLDEPPQRLDRIRVERAWLPDDDHFIRREIGARQGPGRRSRARRHDLRRALDGGDGEPGGAFERPPHERRGPRDPGLEHECANGPSHRGREHVNGVVGGATLARQRVDADAKPDRPRGERQERQCSAPRFVRLAPLMRRRRDGQPAVLEPHTRGRAAAAACADREPDHDRLFCDPRGGYRRAEQRHVG